MIMDHEEDRSLINFSPITVKYSNLITRWYKSPSDIRCVATENAGFRFWYIHDGLC